MAGVQTEKRAAVQKLFREYKAAGKLDQVIECLTVNLRRQVFPHRPSPANAVLSQNRQQIDTMLCTRKWRSQETSFGFCVF